ncbi:ABC transporter ATP-binding protein [Sedimentibacter sp. MB31-C6]|uniref:ABC transporter ATP-binding protein n=1 Tax=Sedimentibacter sp. MB31-C6 TaxID=3109366 RepID=UPI002DDCF5BC|nr:ABC transporter ATP-binding protein [Sedimentibacter sp. MB36-C1]WSI03230.1 ABC transporter ATP-binding protein [Sedimentibacter sp. MB36-C1]
MIEIINTTNLTKIYGKVHAVDSVNLSVKQGEIFGFIGLNGAGKTTTIRMLLGMISPTSGQCYLQGKRVSAGNINTWRDVGYIVETPYSYPELTVRENLEIVRKLRGIDDKSCVNWIINKLKLEEYESKKAKYLSLGNAQRLGIAKAIIHKPKILILDEPTNGLDPAGIVEVRQLLLDLAKNSSVTVLVSSHKLDEISKIASNIAIIHEGKLVKEIDVKQLENQLKKSLILDGKNRIAMKTILSKAGYKANVQGESSVNGFFSIQNDDAVRNPEKIATLLVNEGYPPTLLKVEKEDLEMYFLRTIKEIGGELK